MATPLAFAALFVATATTADPAVVAEPGPEFHGVPTIELITMGSGDALYTLWGHAAVRVIRPGRDVVYNFGSIDFSDGFFIRMMSGQVDAFVGRSTYPRTHRIYSGEGRRIDRRVLQLSPQVAEKVARSLETLTRGDRGTYRYHHFLDNCSTQVADVVDRALDGQWSKTQTAPVSGTFRAYALALIRHRTLLYVAVDVVMSDAVDRPLTAWDTRFLPDHLDRLVDASKIDGLPLVARHIEAFRPPNPRKGPGTWPWAKVYLLFVAPLLAIMLKWPRLGALIWLATAGLLGGAVTVLWLGTRYDFLQNNWNVLVLPPTHLIALVILARTSLWNHPGFRVGLRTYAALHAVGLFALAVALATGHVAQAIGPALGLAIGPGLVMAVRLQKPKNGGRSGRPSSKS